MPESNVTLFSRYSQKENRTTHYCLLVLKLLYEENPKHLAEALSDLVGESADLRVGVQFHQQRRTGGSVPDGLLTQPAFSLHVETKHTDWFSDGQLVAHLDGIAPHAGARVLLALANFDAVAESRFAAVKAHADGLGVTFVPVTFEQFLAAVERDGLPKNLADTVADFRAYLDEENLLPTWRGLLDVCNCAGAPDDQTVHNVYLCPASGGAYRHSRARFFGMYRNKGVERVAEIEGVVDVALDDATEVLWTNVGDAHALGERALATARAVRPGADYPIRVFVLGPLVMLDAPFAKDSRGGMMGSKQYFDVSGLGAADASDLAFHLSGRAWSEFS